MKRKIFALALALTMIFSMIPLTAVAADDTPTATPGTAKVATLDGAELTLDALIAAMTAEDFDGYAGKTLTLTADIVVNSWTTVATFKGKLDGAGHKISGLNDPLFDKLDGATVKGLTVEADIVMAPDSTANKGIVANSSANEILFENCTVNGSILSTTSIEYPATGQAQFAGYVAVTGGAATFKNCINNADIKLTTSKKQVEIGGFIGRSNGVVSFSGCQNNGDMKISATGNGGIISGYVAFINKKATFKNCVNYGSVTTDVPHGGAKAGGLGAVLNTATEDYIFENCFNYGDIYGACMAGGIAGDNRGKLAVTRCYNFGSAHSNNTGSANCFAGGIVAAVLNGSANIQNCVNHGAVITEQSKISNSGGIVGATWRALTVKDCINYGAITSNYSAGGVFGWLALNMDNSVSLISECCSFGTAKGDEKHSSGLFGAYGSSKKSAQVTIENCYYVPGPEHSMGADTAGNKYTDGTDFTVILKYQGNEEKTLKSGSTTDASKFRGEFADSVSAAIDPLAKKTEAELIALLAIRNINVQSSAVAENKFNVRFVAGIDSLGYSKTGFELIRVELNGAPSNTVKKEANTVYTSVKGYDETGKEISYTAEQLKAAYLSVITVSDIPADRTVTFLLRPYVISEDGETTLYGTVCSVTYANGKLVTE